MFLRHFIAATVAIVAMPLSAEPPLEEDFEGVLRACDIWLTSPDSWRDGTEPFVTSAGFGDRMEEVQSVPELMLPPENLRVENRYWRISSSPDAGYVLVVSERYPFCHISGGGPEDFQPIVERVLNGNSFLDKWEHAGDRTRDDMVTTAFRNREDSTLAILVSRGTEPGLRRDRVQVIATAIYGSGI